MNGNGGSLYIDMNFETQSNFEIKDATFHECQSNSSSSSSVPPTGYGAAIFLTGNGNYNPSSQVINMHGMKLYNNQASQGGQSLFVAISKLKELCQQSIAGQYVKGNYSNITSNLSMLEVERKERLGNGAFGVVRHVIEKRTQIHMAWKEVNYETLKEKQLVDNEVTLMREIYRKIKHNLPPTSFYHIVQLLGFFVNEDKAYLVMEYYERGDLRKYINELRKMGADIKDKKCYEIVGQLAQSLNQLHRNEILHGDLKPENVLLTQDLKVKLADFGLARQLQIGRGYTTNHGVFSKHQKFQDKGQQQKLIQTPACDIWAFGVMIFELLAQRHPFYDNNEDLNEQEFAQRVINQPPAQLPDNYPLKLKNLIKQMLIKDPVHRISAEQILQNPEVAAALPQI
ncbi:MAG: putative NEK protein kinase [Streblomastix strix]|uniref:non-specific serine/threonine protein kinase n=1 Tax=Streblomastix strix TaxID=222440 RepID=A0A5J4WEL2_9EUKA|nr:MAG: putative NEK protein kinase [Streblomastix strix]